MKSRNRIIIICFVLLYGFIGAEANLFGQIQTLHQAASFELTTPNVGYNTYEAWDKVRLLPGFTSTSTNQSFRAFINPSLVIDEDYIQTPIDDNRPFDVTLAVGSINGAINTSSSGQLTYSIPLALTPGTNNMVPALSLNYSSQTDNGVMGIGWNLAGLSSIKRSNKTIIPDGVVEGVKMTYNDRFSLDGNRLLVTSGTYGNNGSVYYTELETFSKITANGTNGNGPDWFLVETKDGRKIYYGNTTDSKLILPGTTGVYNWLISKIVDNQGNYIEYKYVINHNSPYIDEIKYTGNTNTGLQPYNIVKFVYSTRSDVNVTYTLGAEITKEWLLTGIKVTNDGNQTHKYILDYFNEETNNYSGIMLYSFLYQITEYGANDDAKYNSTVFNYDDIDEEPYLVEEPNLNVGGHFPTEPLPVSRIDAGTKIYNADFNGDGKDDFLTINNSFHNPPDRIGECTIRVLVNDLDGAHEIYTHTFYPSSTSHTGYVLSDVKLADFNGDGMCDILFMSNNFDADNILHQKPANGSYSITMLYATGNSGQNSFVFSDVSPLGGPFYFSSSDVKCGDFDGDNRMDFATIKDLNTNSQTCIVSSFPATLPANSYSFQTDLIGNNSLIKFLIGDYNGDGKDELLGMDNAGYKIYVANQSPSILFSGSAPLTPNQSSTAMHFTGDFNGDGKTDLFSWDDFGSGGPSRFFYSTGTTFAIQQTPTLSGDPFGYIEDDNTIVRDMNGDGKTDIVDVYETWSGSAFIAHVDVLYAKGNNNFQTKEFEELVSSLLTADVKSMHFGDYNGDGKIDCSYHPYTITGQWDYEFIETAGSVGLINFKANHKKRLITSIVNGFNEKVEFEYKPMAFKDVNNIKVLTNNNLLSGYPVSNFKSSDYVLTKIKTDDGVGGFITKDMKYEDAYIHRTGRGFLGFKKIISTYSTGEVVTIESELLSGVNLMAKKYSTKERPLGTVIENTHFYNAVYNTAVGGYFNYNSQVDYTDALKGTSYSSTYTYSPADIVVGNLTSETTNYINENASTTKSYEYLLAGAWCASRLISLTTLFQRSGEDPITRRTSCDYYTAGGNKGLLKTVVANPTLPNALTYSFSTYDAYGNLLQTIISAADIASRSTSKVYDDRGRFLIKSINELGQITQDNTVYDQRTGRVTSVKDIKGLITSFEYDGFGQQTKIIPAVGPSINISVGFTPAGVNNGSLFYKTVSSTANAPVTEYFDYKQRSVQKMTKGFGGTDIFSETTYNNKGLVSSISEPHFAAASVINLESYGYNSNYQINSITSPVKDISLAYNNNSITTTDNLTGQATIKTYNSFSELTGVVEDGNTIAYSYNAAGQNSEIDVSGTITNITFDDYGYQHSLVDPDAGTTEFTYNSLGQLVSQTDANQLTSTVSYDLTGRVLTQINPEGTTVFIYDTETHGEGEVASIAGPGNITYNYKYDVYGRIWRESQTIDAVVYSTDYEYNTNNEVSKITYPSSTSSRFSVERTYDGFGHLSTLKDGSTQQTIYTNQLINAIGQAEQYLYGNGVTINNEYDPESHKITAMTAIPSGAPTLFQYSYGYDPNSFLMNSRSDVVKNTIEYFENDEYNRLTTITGGPGVPSSTTSYDPNGNVSNVTGIGSYVYAENGAGEHAVTSIVNNTATITANPQVITYTSFNKVATIDENNYNLVFTYGPDFSRKKTVLKQGTTTICTKIFLPNYEKETMGMVTREWHYINGSDGLAAIYEKIGTTGTMYYIHKDHLGSIIGATNQSGAIVTGTLASFDAWGNRRDPDTWQPFSTPPPQLYFERGFTGHEHLERFGLINMNGRMYDPLIKRFLSPDIVNQSPGFSQAYNRYSYCLNNPLNMVDLNGYEYDEDFDGWPPDGAPLDWEIWLIMYDFLFNSSENTWHNYPEYIQEWSGNTAYIRTLDNVLIDADNPKWEQYYKESIVDAQEGASQQEQMQESPNDPPVDNYDDANMLTGLGGGASNVGSVLTEATKMDPLIEGAADVAKLRGPFARVSAAGAALNTTGLIVIHKKDGYTLGEYVRITLNGVAVVCYLTRSGYAQGAATIFTVGDGFGAWNGYYRQIDKMGRDFSTGNYNVPGFIMTGLIIPWMGGVEY